MPLLKSHGIRPIGRPTLFSIQDHLQEYRLRWTGAAGFNHFNRSIIDFMHRNLQVSWGFSSFFVCSKFLTLLICNKIS
jgi:hypothetical protein